MNKETATRNVLARTINFKDYVSIGAGALLGVGWIVYTKEWLFAGGSLGAIIAFVIGGFLLSFIGQTYAELTSAIPVAGGEFSFCYKAFGSKLSFVTAWMMIFAYAFICPFETVAIGWLLEYIIPQTKILELYQIGGYSVRLPALLFGFLFGLIIVIFNYLGIKKGTNLQFISICILLLSFFIFVVIALVYGSVANLPPFFEHRQSSYSIFYSIFSVLAIVPFWLAGFGTIPQSAEESGKEMDPKNLGRAIICSIFIGVIFYSLVIFSVSLIVPWEKTLLSFNNDTLVVAEVFRIALKNEIIVKLVLIAGLMCLLTSLNSFFIASTRTLFAASRGGLLPKWFSKVHPKYHTPKNAIIFVGVFTVLGPFFGKALINQIVEVGSFAYIFIWFITCISAVKLRKVAPDLNRPYKVNKSTHYIGAVIAFILMLFFIVPGSPVMFKWPFEILILVIWILLGVIVHYCNNGMNEEERAYNILGKYTNDNS